MTLMDLEFANDVMTAEGQAVAKAAETLAGRGGRGEGGGVQEGAVRELQTIYSLAIRLVDSNLESWNP